MSTASKTSWKTRLSASAFAMVGLATVFVVLCIGACVGFPCFPMGFRYGIWTDQCPAGDLRLGARVDVSGLVRGGEGTVSVHPYARYLRGSGGDTWVAESSMYRGAWVTLTLLDAEGVEVPGLVTKDWTKRYGTWDFVVELPEIV